MTATDDTMQIDPPAVSAIVADLRDRTSKANAAKTAPNKPAFDVAPIADFYVTECKRAADEGENVYEEQYSQAQVELVTAIVTELVARGLPASMSFDAGGEPAGDGWYIVRVEW